MSKQIAGGYICPSRFVYVSMYAPHHIFQCDNNIPMVGVSHEKVRNSVFAAMGGDDIEVYDEGTGDILLELGGPVKPGNRLRSDAEGRGVAIELPGISVAQHYGAIALENGIEGDKIHVFVTLGSYGGEV